MYIHIVISFLLKSNVETQYYNLGQFWANKSLNQTNSDKVSILYILTDSWSLVVIVE